MVKALFFNGHMLKDINKKFIMLISESDNLGSTNHFRPISLCNICYKIITKILANRVKHLLNKIISPLQGAFGLDRLINDNIMLAHEIMHSLKKKKGRWVTWLLNLTWKKLIID